MAKKAAAKPTVAFFVSFDYSSNALQEVESFFKCGHKVIVALTVKEILDEQIARKLA
jgi:ribosomal protein S6